MAGRSTRKSRATDAADGVAGPSDADPGDAGPDDAATTPGWDELERRLAGALERMAPETYLILGTAAGDDDPGYYVQFAHATSALRVEAVSSAYLSGHPLRPDQEAELDRLGWMRPAPGDRERNVHRTWRTPLPVGEVARLAIETLRDVYGVADAGRLRYRYESFSGQGVDDLDLGLPREGRSRTPHRLARGHDIASLRADVLRAVAGFLGTETLAVDADGDIPVRAGSALYFVRIVDGLPPAVQLFSPILNDVRITPELLDALNEINAHVRYGRVFASATAVVVSMELPAINLTPEVMAFACTELGNLADHLDDVLHGRFGGRTMFESQHRLIN